MPSNGTETENGTQSRYEVELRLWGAVIMKTAFVDKGGVAINDPLSGYQLDVRYVPPSEDAKGTYTPDDSMGVPGYHYDPPEGE